MVSYTDTHRYATKFPSDSSHIFPYILPNFRNHNFGSITFFIDIFELLHETTEIDY